MRFNNKIEDACDALIKANMHFYFLYVDWKKRKAFYKENQGICDTIKAC